MIYICTHKDFQIPNIEFNDNYKIVSNTKLNNQYNVPVLYTTNHLNTMAKGYCEGLMIREVYLRENESWIGINHYRRFFKDLEPGKNTISQPIKLNMNMNNYFYQQLGRLDLIEIEKIIDSYFPKYRMNYSAIDIWHPCNMFYFDHDTFNKYCQFCFNVLDIFNEKFKLFSDNDIVKFVGGNDYRARLHGYIMECLSTIFFIKEFNKYNVNIKNIIQI